jgi:hypothetical protein
METDLDSKMLHFLVLEFWTTEKVQKPSNSEYTKEQLRVLANFVIM